MEDYPEELRTPPVTLVALVGLPELHSPISLFLHTEQPPINTLALPDFANVIAIGGKERKPVDARMPPPVGIIKAEWLLKHRTRAPAVLAVLFDREQVYGDPAQWLQVCTHLDNIKNIIRGRNIKLVVIIVQPTLHGDVNEDRLVAFRKRAEIDPRNCLTFITHDPTELKRSLGRLGSVLGEHSTNFYREEGRRVKLRIDKKSYSSVDLSVRYNFKVAVYAEFRRDWVTALKFYETAYTLLQEVVSTPVQLLPLQRTVELKTVSEQLHFKVATLLLHSGKESEAVRWFKQHIAYYKQLIGPLEGAFMHWAWISRQFHVFAELLQTSFGTGIPTLLSNTTLSGPPITEREFQPGYYHQVAAFYMAQRRHSFESALLNFESFEDAETADMLGGPAEEIGPPLYIGQAPRLLRRGNTLDLQCPTPAEYFTHAIVMEKNFSHSRAAIDLLTKAHEQYKLIQASRTIYQLGSEMAREYFTARDYANAKHLFDTVAGMYRKEAWVALLGASLGYLRECARQLGLLKEFVEYTLELASLPVQSDFSETHLSGFSGLVGPAGPLGHSQRVQIHEEIIGVLQEKQTVLPAHEGDVGLALSETQPLFLEIDLLSPLRAVLSVCVAFHELTVKPDQKTQFTIALLTHMPLDLMITKLEIVFNQPECNVVLWNDAADDRSVDSTLECPGKGLQEKGGFSLELQPYTWKRFSIDLIAGQSGRLECLTATAHIGPHATICCQVESPATRESIPLWIMEPGLELLPFADIDLAFLGQKVIQVEEPEALIDVTLMVSGAGLIGEVFHVPIKVKSKGHAIYQGELEAYLSTSISPGNLEAQPFSPVVPSVVAVPAELLTTEDASSDSVRQSAITGDIAILQKVTGPVKIPLVPIHQSCYIPLYVRWLEAQSVTLMLSISYASADTKEEKDRAPQRFWIQRSVQLECEEPLSISHRFVAPYRRDSLLPSNLSIDRISSSSISVTLPLNEMSLLVVTAKNSCSTSIGLLSVEVEEKDKSACQIKLAGQATPRPTIHLESSSKEVSFQRDLPSKASKRSNVNVDLSPGETFSQLFLVFPAMKSSSLDVGAICYEWERKKEQVPSPEEIFQGKDTNGVKSQSPVLEIDRSLIRFFPPVASRVRLPNVTVEETSLFLTLDCPPYAVLGVPFVLFFNIHNQTRALQDVKFSVIDAQSFLFSGASRDLISVLPASTYVVTLKLVPLASGMQQLPQITLTASCFSASFQPSPSSNQIFVFPSTHALDTQKPQLSNSIGSINVITDDEKDIIWDSTGKLGGF